MDFISLLCSVLNSIFFVFSNDCLFAFLIDAVPDSGKGQPTTSLDHPSVSGDASNIKRSVEGNA